MKRGPRLETCTWELLDSDGVGEGLLRTRGKKTGSASCPGKSQWESVQIGGALGGSAHLESRGWSGKGS